MLSVHDFRGERSELAFLKFFIESAQMLKVLVIVYANGCFSSRGEANSKVKALFAGRVGILKVVAIGTLNKALISLLRTLSGSLGVVPLDLVSGLFKFQMQVLFWVV